MSGKQIIFIALVIAVLAFLPVVIKKDNIINLAVYVLLFVSLASSWNILGGYTGQTNLGHAAFFGAGTLATRFLWLSGWPLFPSLLAGGLLAVAFALLIGIPAFRLRGRVFRYRYAGAIADTLHHRREHFPDDLLTAGSRPGGLSACSPILSLPGRGPSHHWDSLRSGQFQVGTGDHGRSRRRRCCRIAGSQRSETQTFGPDVPAPFLAA